MFFDYLSMSYRWEFNICFNSLVVFHLVFSIRANKQRPQCLRPVRKLKNPFPSIFQFAGLFFQSFLNFQFLPTQIHLQASRFHLSYNTLLYLIPSPQWTLKYLDKLFAFYRDSLGLHQWRIDLVECSLKAKLNVFKNIFFAIFLKIWNVSSIASLISVLYVFYITRNVILKTSAEFRKYSNSLHFERIMLFFQICINFHFPAARF